MSKYKLVLVTIGSNAEALAHKIIESRAAACVNIIPSITSVYRWQGNVEQDKEQLLVIKTTESKLKELERVVHENHPYDVPEFIALDIEQGSQKYLEFISKSIE